MKMRVFEQFIAGCKERYQRVENKAGDFATWLLGYMIAVVALRLGESIYHIVNGSYNEAFDSLFVLAFFIVLDITINRFATSNKCSEV